MQLHKPNSIEKSVLTDSLSDRARLLCGLAKEQEEAGDFEAARQIIDDFWQRVGERPRLDGLDNLARAEVLLRAGTLSGWIGSTRQIAGAQGIAKDLISESAGVFERLGSVERVAEARIDLAICYWREGAVDEARVTLQDVLSQLGDLQTEQRLRALLNIAIVEKVSVRYKDALRIHTEAAPLFNESSNHALRGKFHNEFATVLKNVGLAERREDYTDRALVEYAAASFHFEQAGHKRFQGVVENNLGFLYVHLGRFQDAHKHLSRARSVAVALKDQGLVAQFDDTRAKAFLGQQRNEEAEAVARRAVGILADGDEESLLAGALTTYGTALSRLGRNKDAFSSFTRAISVAEQAGDPESGGIAALTIIEELGSTVPLIDLRGYYRKAESNLTLSQHQGIQWRLGQCARRVLDADGLRDQESRVETEVRPIAHSPNGNGSKLSALASQEFAAKQEMATCSLEEEVLRYEGGLIKQALESSGGSVTRAARSLGITHQGLAFILNGRHKDLLSVRTPIKPRRRSIIRYQ